MAEDLNFSELYRFPFSKNDNSNGWLEITTHCNMACPGCYRGCDRKKNVGKHKSLGEINEELNYLKKVRNCHTISLGGGEPLTHPRILEITKMIYSKNLNSVFFTNGRLLNEFFLRKLKKVGATGFLIRLDSLQTPKKELTELQLNKERERYANMLSKVGGVNCALSCVVDKNNLSEINNVVSWCFKNSERVGGLLIILKRKLYLLDSEKKENIQSQIKQEELRKEISKKFPDLKYCAYLGSELEDLKAKWLWAIQIFQNNNLLGYAGKKVPEFLEVSYHFKNGRYFHARKNKRYSFYFPNLLFLCLICGEKEILKNSLKEILKNPLNLFKKYRLNQLLIVDPPEFINKKRDICDSCPDAILYNGRLVPSCILEEIKKVGKPIELKNKK